jgi:uncharacterized protein YndB with AHSA1/START domain
VSTLAQTVERSILLDASREEVWDALTDASLLAEWLADEVELDLREGGEIVCRYKDGEERRGEIKQVEEAERLAFQWWREESGLSRVELILDAVADQTLMSVVERQLDPTAPILLAAGWSAAVGRLRLVVGRLVLA